MMRILLTILLSLFLFAACKSSKNLFKYEGESFSVEQVSKHCFRHISYLETETWGKVACNGMIVIENGEALIFDTPNNDEVSRLLNNFIKEELGAVVVGVVVNHFHNDCLGGLQFFKNANIPTYANNRTIALAKENNEIIPEIGFDVFDELEVGGSTVENHYLGEGHTSDNIVSYHVEDKVLFGGCLVKCMNASKGYLGDANTEEWPLTISKVQEKFPEIRLVIPGHGKEGGSELLEYTKNLFAQ